MPNVFYLIDGHAQIFRSYFAIRSSPSREGLSSPITGEPTHAVFAFAAMLIKLFDRLRPRRVVMAIDSPGKTFRDELFDQYKATRPPIPDDFRSQEQRIFELVRLFRIPLLAAPGFEADDILATLTRRVLDDPAQPGSTVRLVSRDKDLQQLLGPRVTMYDIHTDTTLDADALLADKGITPTQVIDYLTMVGDTSDNVPGVPGVGPKTAAQLLQQYGSLDAILQHLADLTPKRRESFHKAGAHLELARTLVTLRYDVPITPASPIEPGDPLDPLPAPDVPAILALFKQLGFRRHQDDLVRVLGTSSAISLPPPELPPPSGEGRGEGRPSRSPPRNTPTHQPTTSPLFAGLAQDDDTSATSSADESSPPSSPPTTTTASAASPPPSLARRVAADPDCDYRCLTTRADLDAALEAMRDADVIAVDTETIGLGHHARLTGISIAWTDHQGVYIPVRSPDPAAHLGLDDVLDALRPLLSADRPGKTGHNIKYDYLVLRHAGLELRGIVFDSMIAGFLLNLPGLGLDELSLSLLGHEMIPIEQLIGPPPRGRTGTPQLTMDKVPLDQITPYAAGDADISLRLYRLLGPRLVQQGMEDLARRVEMPLVRVLAEMERAGVTVDPAVLQQQKQSLAGRVVELRDAIHDAAGAPFNIDSPRQLADVLFTRLGLPVVKRTKSGPSTDIEVLEALGDREDLDPNKSRIAGLIVEYRQLTKLLSTYLDALRDAIDPGDHRVHARFHQTGAATGRLSSSDPNLQNIPVRTELGRRIRRAFVAPPGHLLLSADYSQIELRILAHLSQDPALIEAFLADRDIHCAVAAEVFGVPPDQVSKEQRAHAKVINFGIVYGVTPFGLSRRIDGLDLEGARRLITDYRKRFAGIDAFLYQCVQQARSLGYVTTIMGRRRLITQVHSGNPNTRSLGERLAINTVVQGSAADLIKLAMVNLFERIERQSLPLRLLLQIHDELVLECPADRADAMARVVQEEMETAMSLRVPLKTDLGIGPDWLSAK